MKVLSELTTIKNTTNLADISLSDEWERLYKDYENKEA